MTYPMPMITVEERDSRPIHWAMLEETLRAQHPLRDRPLEDFARSRDSLVSQVARQEQVPVLLALGLAQTENTRGIPWSVSPTGDIGLLQINARAQETSPEVLADRRKNVQQGLRLLRELYNQSGDWSQALKSYHLGPTGARKHLKTGDNYVQRVRMAMQRIQRARVRP